jgi:hypothetical protein
MLAISLVWSVKRESLSSCDPSPTQPNIILVESTQGSNHGFSLLLKPNQKLKS